MRRLVYRYYYVGEVLYTALLVMYSSIMYNLVSDTSLHILGAFS